MYVTNRAEPFGTGENSVSVLPIDLESGLPGKPIQSAKGGSKQNEKLDHPRHAVLVPLPNEPVLVVVS